jgi:hypothetical protein
MSDVQQIAANGTHVPAPRPRRAPVVHIDLDNPISLYLDTNLFEQLQRVARLMATSGLAPDHLRGPDKIADAFLVVAQAFRWRMDPFAVAQHTYVYQGKLGYEGKLIAGVINSSPRIEQPLSYRYEGSGGGRKVVVTGRLRGETEDRPIDGTVDGWKTGNEKWRTMPDQMLAYRGAREWARRHMPEAVLGITTADELDHPSRRGPEYAQAIGPDAAAFERAAAGRLEHAAGSAETA